MVAWVILAGAGALFAPVGSAVPVTGRFETHGAGSLTGDGLGELEVFNFLAEGPDAIGTELDAVWVRADIEVREITLVASESPVGSGLFPVKDDLLERFVYEGSLAIRLGPETTLPNGTLMVIPAPQETRFLASLNASTVMRWDHPEANRGSRPEGSAFEPAPEGRPLRVTYPGTDFHIENVTVAIRGPVDVVVFGPSVALDEGAQVIQTGRREEWPVGGQVPVEPGVVRQVYALVHVLEGTVSVSPARAGAWGATHLAIRSATQLELHGASEIEGLTNFTPKQGAGIVEVLGVFNATAEFDGDGGSWSVAGDMDELRLNGAVGWSEKRSLAAVATGLGALALLAILWKLVQQSAAAVVARSHRDALGHPVRRGILDLAAGRPFLAERDVQAALQTSRAAIRFHLAVLTRGGWLIRTGHGRRAFYRRGITPNSFDVAGRIRTGTNAQWHPTLANPMRAQIMMEVARHRQGISHAQLTSHWHGPGSVPSAALFLHHAKNLEKCGLVMRSRSGRAVLVRPTPAWTNWKADASVAAWASPPDDKQASRAREGAQA